MERFMPHYTCKKIEQTGFTCLKILNDFKDKVGVFEKKPKDYSDVADKINKKIIQNSPWKIPIIYDLAELSKHEILILKEEDKHLKDGRGIEKYSKKLSKKFKHKINPKIAVELIMQLEKNPVMLFINLNELYKQTNLGLGWIIITEYGEKNDEFIIYDPMYYTRYPRSKNWQRMPNTPKKRFIVVKADYLLNIWEKTKNTTVIRERKKFQPFIREFLTLL